MNITIEKNDIFKIYIFLAHDIPKDQNPPKDQSDILHCIRLKPFVREEVWNINEDSIINDIIIKFKSLKENEAVN